MAGNSILDFETLFPDVQELLNGSGFIAPSSVCVPEVIGRGVLTVWISNQKN